MVTDAERITGTVVQNARLAMIIEHMRANNLSYIVGTFAAWQMGLLDGLITYGSGICS